MSEAELIFTALAELSTRQIAETEQAKGVNQNAIAGKKGGKIAKDARFALEQKKGKNVVTNENFLKPPKGKKIGLINIMNHHPNAYSFNSLMHKSTSSVLL